MNGSKRTKVAEEAQFPECYLWVSSSGIIRADSEERQDIEGYQTWLSHFVGNHFRLRRLFPARGLSVMLPIDAEGRESIETKTRWASVDCVHTANHEAGHAILGYTVRFRRTRLVDLRVRVLPQGDLYAQIERRKADSPLIVGARTSIETNAADFSNPSSIDRLKHAFLVLGGIAGCQGDARGAEDDEAKLLKMVTSIHELVGASTNESNDNVTRLSSELRNLALEIIADPIVADRHKHLASALIENRRLDRTQIEDILTPATLPDYSGRIVEIARKLNVPVPPEKAEAPTWPIE